MLYIPARRGNVESTPPLADTDTATRSAWSNQATVKLADLFSLNSWRPRERRVFYHRWCLAAQTLPFSLFILLYVAPKSCSFFSNYLPGSDFFFLTNHIKIYHHLGIFLWISKCILFLVQPSDRAAFFRFVAYLSNKTPFSFNIMLSPAKLSRRTWLAWHVSTLSHWPVRPPWS